MKIPPDNDVYKLGCVIKGLSKRMRYSILVVTQYYISIKVRSHGATATVSELFLG